LRVSFSCFKKLKEIDLSENQISVFPKSLVDSPLKILNLSGNKLNRIPEIIGSFESLVSLDLSYNEITEIPEEIGALSNLRVLNLSGNKISILPKNFAKLTKLQELYINGNPIGDAPLEIANQGLSAVLNYYLHLGASVKLNEAKMLVVGHGAVGKTFLINKLIKNETPDSKSTEGIDILKWIFNNDDGSIKLRLNCWDFGGQEIYHSTHQFFLTKRSIYLFVWEARKDDSLINFDYWLNIIKVLSSSSPVIVVLNKTDERVKEIDEKSLRERFPNIKAFFGVSALTGKNIHDLSDFIDKTVGVLPHIGDKLPKVWSEIRAELENLTTDYISLEAYEEICAKYGLMKEQSKHLSQYFHDLGVFLHFQDNSVLKPVMFLNPEWVTNSVYKILDHKDVIKSFGRFTLELLDELMPEYTNQQISYVIELMKKFELCFKLNKEYIVPELLSPSELDVSIQFQNTIKIIYQYDFMPAGILPRLIVRLKDMVLENRYWKHGLYLTYKNSKAFVSSNQFARTITIVVTGSEKATFLERIKHDLEGINLSLNNPDHSIKIQCNCSSCVTSDNPFMFDFDYLERAKDAQLKTVNCQSSLENIDLISLVGPYEVKKEFVSKIHGFRNEDLFGDLIEISSRLLERKGIHRTEDLITDNFTDNLRSKGYVVTDQTRSGLANKLAGELDIMIRDFRQMPVAILEAMRLSSLGPENKTVFNHLNKLITKYDSNGLSVSYMLVYVQSSNFGHVWRQYFNYLENLHSHPLYDEKAASIIGAAPLTNKSQRSGIKIFSTEHIVKEELKRVFHLLIDFG
jgi:internalin A